MFAEYLRLISLGGDTPMTFGDIRRAAIVVASGIFLMLVGYKIKRIWGAVIALLFGTVVYLFVNGMLHF